MGGVRALLRNRLVGTGPRGSRPRGAGEEKRPERGNAEGKRPEAETSEAPGGRKAARGLEPHQRSRGGVRRTQRRRGQTLRGRAGLRGEVRFHPRAVALKPNLQERRGAAGGRWCSTPTPPRPRGSWPPPARPATGPFASEPFYVAAGSPDPAPRRRPPAVPEGAEGPGLPRAACSRDAAQNLPRQRGLPLSAATRLPGGGGGGCRVTQAAARGPGVCCRDRCGAAPLAVAQTCRGLGTLSRPGSCSASRAGGAAAAV